MRHFFLFSLCFLAIGCASLSITSLQSWNKTTTVAGSLPALEGFEQGDAGWKLMSWPTTVPSIISLSSKYATEGQNSLDLQILPDLVVEKEVVVGREERLDLATATSLTLDVYNDTNGEVILSLALDTGPTYDWHESTPVTLKQGLNLAVSFNLKSSDWKTKAANWQFTQPLRHPEQVKGIYLKFISPGEPIAGSLFLDQMIVQYEPKK
jgi:hypothetical protein